jgi:adenosine kinase
VTRGELGSSVTTAAGTIEVPAVPPRRMVDPTGVGDAFRGGLMKGMAMGLSYDASAQVGSVAATYALEHLGGQSHAYSWEEFRQRYERHFAPFDASAA